MAAKLNALMPLRFIGAFVVVIAHTFDYFNFSTFTPMYSQIITFFFVLSGFILTYAYPSLNNSEAVKRFWYARFARIWPLHITTLLILLLILPSTSWTVPSNYPFLVAITNILLIQSWIPIADFAVSYNAPSWSTSVEIFFYLLFPLLIHKFHQTWLWKLLGAFSIVLITIFIINPFCNDSMTIYFFMFMNPATRLFEFVLGMVTALAWRKVKPLIKINQLTATLIELFIILAVIINTIFYLKLFPYTGSFKKWLFDAGFVWLLYSSVAPLFALLIFVLALERGYISYLLSFPIMIFLGEISFSLYLVHQIFIRYYVLYKQQFSSVPPWLAFSVYFSITLLTSILLWYVIERPCRRFLIGLWPLNKKQFPIPENMESQRT